MEESAVVKRAPSRSQLLRLLDRANFNVADDRRRWVLHDLLLKVTRSLDEKTGISTVYLTQKDRHTLADEELGPKFQRVWVQGPQARKDATFTLNEAYSQEAAHRLKQAIDRR